MRDGFDDPELTPEEPAGRAEARHRRRDLEEARRASRRRAIAIAAPWVAAVAFAAGAITLWAALASSGAPVVPTAPRVTAAPRLLVERTFRASDSATSQPTGVAISGDRLYVADPARRVVDVFSRDGSRVATIGAGLLEVPVYVAVGPVDGRVYVSDRGLGAVEVFAADGTPFGVLEPGGLSVRPKTTVTWRPLGLAFASDGTLYVADSSDDAHVAVFSPAGSRIATMGADVPAGRSGRPLAFPNGLVVTSDQVVLADSNNGRLVYFTRTGTYLRTVTVQGMPRGIAQLSDGGMLISDAASGELRATGADGEVRATLVHAGEWGLTVQSPAGVAVDRDGSMYVADTLSGQIAVVVETATPDPKAASQAARPRWPAISAAILAIAALASVIFGVFSARARTRARESAL